MWKLRIEARDSIIARGSISLWARIVGDENCVDRVGERETMMASAP
jgi:hypothetical protein